MDVNQLQLRVILNSMDRFQGVALFLATCQVSRRHPGHTVETLMNFPLRTPAYRRSVLGLALLSALATPLAAQAAASADADAQTLDRVVVSAAGFEQKITDAPASISIITAEEPARQERGEGT